jgi:DNA-binding response OmpR family regulator
MHDKENKINILIVDDEPFIRRSLALVFKQKNYQVHLAENGQEAWEKLLEGLKPTIMFVDVMMPKLSGFELSRLVKSHNSFKDIYVILLTSRWQKSDYKKAKAIGIDEYMTKPFSPSQIIRRVENILKAQLGAIYA